jgi:hypothetical protein
MKPAILGPWTSGICVMSSLTRKKIAAVVVTALTRTRFVIGLALCGAIAQSVLAGDGDAAGSATSTQSDFGQPDAAISTTGPIELSQDEAERLIRSLGATTFAERERAMGEILRLGAPMVPHLRKAIESQEDPELVLRAKTTLSQMTVDDLESRIETFLTGAPGTSEKAYQWFDGWQQFESALGDSLAIRELFIEVMKAHPDVTKSLGATTADRASAAESVSVSVRVGMMERRQFPTVADGVALLIPLTDPAVPVGGGYDSTVLSVFNRHYGTLRRDAQLWPAISALLESWSLRSRIENRIDVLWYTMQWDLPAAGELGLRTLDETTDIETIQTAFQAISRFRTAADAARLVNWLDDERPAVTRMPVLLNNKPLKVTVADTALATIAILHKVQLKDLGMPTPELHPKVGFLIDNAGFTAEQAGQRAEAIARAKAWCEGKSLPGEPRS